MGPGRRGVAPLITILAIAASGAVVAPAAASSLVYLDAASNVWIASPDGTVKRQLTSDAAAGKLYVSPSMQDDGTVVAPNQNDFTSVLNPDATTKAGPWIKPAPGSFSTALLWAHAHPTATFYVVQQLSAALGATPDATVSIAALNAPGTNGCSVYPCRYQVERPRFLPGTQDYTVITEDGETVRVDRSSGGGVDWLALPAPGPGTPDLNFRGVDVSRTGARVLVEVTPEGSYTTSGLLVLQGSGPPPAAVTPLCGLDVFAAGDARPRWSPDGTQIAFSQPDGVHVASAPVAGAGDDCVLAGDRLVVPGGRDADWSPYTIPTGGGGPGGGPAGGGGPGGAPAGGTGTSRPRVSSARATAASVKRGIVLRVLLSRAAQISVRVQSLTGKPRRPRTAATRPRLLGTVRFRGRAGANTVTIKRVAGKRLRKGRYRLAITVPGGGPPAVLAVAIRR